MTTDEPSMQSLGGKARAESLTPAKRSEIASLAASARWGGHRATHSGMLKIGPIEIEAVVLEDGTRVLSRAGFVRAIGRRGKVKGGVEYEPESKLPVFLGADNLKPFIDNELIDNSNPIYFRPLKGGGIAMGYKAQLLPAVCNVFLDAKHANALRGNQEHIAEQCRILSRGFALIGITAMVDEATGYQEVRDKLALQKILEKYLTDEWAKWSRTFEPEFYQNLFRLKGVDISALKGTTKPQYVGHWTNDVVYSRLAPGIKEELRKKNPRLPSGSRARKHHQHFTHDYGNPALKTHLSNVTFLMKSCANWNEFKQRLDRSAPKLGETFPLDIDA